MNIVTLTTDFGMQDWFVGTIKGVILRINPRAEIVDITHGLAAGDIRGGAFALAASYRFFPKGAVHVTVLDPGVGSARNAIAVQTANYFFIGPDNGVLSFALTNEKIKSVCRLENKKYFLQPVSHTFHGRDIFAPVAAHLSRAVPIQKFGPAQKAFVRLPWPKPRVRRNGIEGDVIYIDKFGNAITNIQSAALRIESEILIGQKRFCPVKEFYQSVPKGKAVGVRGSSGFLEIAINGGSAAKKLRLKIGDRVNCRPALLSRVES